MIILGLHFGHDASISVVRDGELLLCVERERLNRTKHAISIHPQDIKACLDDVGVSVEEVDFVTVTSTQNIDLLMLEKKELRIRLEGHEDPRCPCPLYEKIPPQQFFQRGKELLEKEIENKEHPYRLFLGDDLKKVKKKNCIPSFEEFIAVATWKEEATLEEMRHRSCKEILQDDQVRLGFHYPIKIMLFGREIPAYLFAHHMAHLAYTFYQSPFERAALLSHDGSDKKNYESGFFAVGMGNKIVPLTPHFLCVGAVYEKTADKIGLGAAAGAGKLMGLSAYGKPDFFSGLQVGNWFNLGEKDTTFLFRRCVEHAKNQGYDLSPIGDKERILEPVNRDIAATTQKWAQESIAKAAEVLFDLLETNNVPSKNLCLTGGVALNCPANTLIQNEGRFENLFVPPAVSDGGLSAGSALALYCNVMGFPKKNVEESPSLAYQGLKKSCSEEAIQRAFKKFEKEIVVENRSEYWKQAAEEISKGSIIGWFEGRSEVGPRALGHRSIIGDPRNMENWKKVNEVKGRERWRPLAPAVLQSEEKRFFSKTKFPSFFMLFNADVESDEVPAITHVDGSARIQSVNEHCGNYYQLLKEFFEITSIPVLMNTSFNGPGEPIVETPEDAIRFLLRSSLDALFFPSFKVTKR